jgi:hypothetical protein
MIGRTYSYSAGGSYVWPVKTNSSGDTIWTRTNGGINTERAFFLSQMSDGNYLIGGYTNSFGTGSEDDWLIIADENGDTLWTQTSGGGNI